MTETKRQYQTILLGNGTYECLLVDYEAFRNEIANGVMRDRALALLESEPGTAEGVDRVYRQLQRECAEVNARIDHCVLTDPESRALILWDLLRDRHADTFPDPDSVAEFIRGMDAEEIARKLLRVPFGM
ncbi:MAG TPA: hypothetical protein VGN12_27435 [Pirellulales bacterium]